MARLAAALLAASALLAPATAGAQAIQSFTGGTTFPFYTNNETVGFTFSTSANLSVTSLGWYALDGSLASSHQVGIWNAAGTLLGSGTVAADSTPGSVGFRYSAVTPFTLAAGQSYFIGGVDRADDGDSYITSVSDLVTAPQITFLGSAVSPDFSGFAFPNLVNQTTTGGRFGANFLFTDLSISAVPEPATWAMMIAGFGMAGGAIRRRRQQVRVSYAA